MLTDFGGNDFGFSTKLQVDGKIVIAGSTDNDFAIARYNNDEVLAASIVDLKAYSFGSNVKIEWSALNELNISQYNIERSIDGKNFIAIGSVKALDNGQQKNVYSYTDFAPSTRDNFYRIKSVSKDGIGKYTDIVKVNFATSATAILVSPNPVKDILHIERLSSSVKTISIIDAKGKLLQKVTTAKSTYSISTKQFAAGIYFLTIDEENKTTTLKFIKE